MHPSCVHVVPRPGFEPGASCSVDKRAIQLRYRGNVHMMVPMRLTFPPPQPDSTGKGRFQDTSRRVRMPGSSPHGSSCEKWWRIDLNNCGLLNLTNGFTVRRIRPLCHATIIGNLHHPVPGMSDLTPLTSSAWRPSKAVNHADSASVPDVHRFPASRNGFCSRPTASTYASMNDNATSNQPRISVSRICSFPCRRLASNQRPPRLQLVALPTELQRHYWLL